ncbi:MAG: beta-lactamase family protein [Tissierellaceae bacterium]|nr:beta-lactamase family protein [Tissierellaceae bacterium]
MGKDLNWIINRYMDLDYFPSAVVKVFGEKDVYYEKAFGNVNMDTFYDVASLTKIVTSTIILKLIIEGRVSLQSTLKEVLPPIGQYKNIKNKFGNTAIKELLIHSSGLIDWYPFYTQKGTFLQILEKVVKERERLEGTIYSDLNFMILGEVIKSSTNKSLEECLDYYIKKPLGISGIFYNPMDKKNIAPSSKGNIIEEEMCKERNLSFEKWRSNEKELIGEVNDGNSFYFFNGVAGHAGIFANVDAYLELGRMYLKSKNPLILNSMENHGGNRGLGWQLGDLYPYGCGHTGFTGTSIWISRERKVGTVIFSNRLMGNWKDSNLSLFRKEVHEYVIKNF